MTGSRSRALCQSNNRRLAVHLSLGGLEEPDPRIALYACALHGLSQGWVLEEPAGGLLGREVIVDDHAVRVVDIPVHAVFDLAMAAPRAFMLVEDRLQAA